MSRAAGFEKLEMIFAESAFQRIPAKQDHSVEAFDESVLRWLARFDESKLDAVHHHY